MPHVPVFTNDVRAAPAGAALANPATFGAPGEALARAGEQLGGEAQAFAERYVEARRQADAANFVSQASTQLGDMQFRWSKTPDRVAATQGFQNEAGQYTTQLLNGIQDPLVRERVQDRVQQEQAIRGLDVQQAAFGLESATRRGQLDLRLQNYAQSAASTDNDLLRAKIFDDARADIAGSVAAGWLRPDEGAQYNIRLKSQMQEVKVRQQFNAVIDNADQLNALSAQLNDPATFPGLQPESREVLQRMVEIRADRMMSRDAVRLQHEDALAERALRQTQTQNETNLLADVYAGKLPDPRGLEAMARSQQISPAGLEAVHSAMARAVDGKDDPRATALLWAGIGPNGPTTRDEVLDAVQRRAIKASTAGEMLRSLMERDKQRDDAVERGAFATLRTALSGQAVEQGLIKDDAVRARQEQAWAQAQGEWNRRVVAGREDPATVLSDMIPRYAAVTPSQPSWLPAPKLGGVYSLDDVKKVYGATKAARDAGQLSDAEFQDQARVLDDYRLFYAEQQRTAPAVKIPYASKPPAGGKPMLGGMQ